MAENEQVTVKAEIRTGRGKNDTRRLRVAGKVPVTIYGGEGEAVSAVAKLSDLAAILRSHSGANTVFAIEIEGANEADVMFQDRQINPLKGRLMHADLKRIVRGQKLEITAPIHLVGEAIGVKEEGGTLDQPLHELQIRCLPRNIPDAIDVDISELKVGDVMHVRDLKVDEDYEILNDPEAVVAVIKFVSDEALAESLTSQVEAGEPEVVTDGDAAGGETTKES
jgi:large subunit ribosomal protein L25